MQLPKWAPRWISPKRDYMKPMTQGSSLKPGGTGTIDVPMLLDQETQKALESGMPIEVISSPRLPYGDNRFRKEFWIKVGDRVRARFGMSWSGDADLQLDADSVMDYLREGGIKPNNT